MPEGKDVSRELTGIPFQQQLTNTESHMDVTFGVGAWELLTTFSGAEPRSWVRPSWDRSDQRYRFGERVWRWRELLFHR